MCNYNAVEFSTRIDNYIPLIYMDVITYPCHNTHASLSNLLLKEPREFSVIKYLQKMFKLVEFIIALIYFQNAHVITLSGDDRLINAAFSKWEIK